MIKKMFNIFVVIVIVIAQYGLGFSNYAYADDYSLNMKNVEIREFILSFSKLVGKTIIVDEKVTGSISIESPKSLSKQELYEIFLMQLGVKGYTVIDNGSGILKVVPSQGAKLDGAEVGIGVPISNSEQIITQIIEVENVNSNQLAATLRPLIDAKVGVIAAYATSNVILLIDRASNVKRISKIIKEVDKADSQRLTIVKLKNASATDLESTLNNITQGQGQVQEQEQNRTPATISADKRTNSLIIRAELSDWLKLKKIIERLDVEVVNTANHKVLYLKYAKATDLVPVLKGVSQNIVESNSGGEESPAALKDVTINAHEQTNAVIISGDPNIISDLENIVASLDIRRAQVMVEAIIAEIDVSKARELGVQWVFAEGNNNVGAINFPASGRGVVNLLSDHQSGNQLSSYASEGFNLGIGRFGSHFGFAALLQALATDQDTNILSTPNLVTLDNEEASIHVGQEVPIITGSTTSSDNANPYQTIDRRDVGIKLTIKPQINEGSAILLDITQEVSSISGIQASDIITNKRVIETTVLVDDGAMIALGGLITDEVQESSSKVPLLGDMPGLGRLFRSDQSKHDKRNLMVFIRPKVLYDQSSATDESRKKYKAIFAEQRQRSINLMPDDKRPTLPSWEEGEISPKWYFNQPIPNRLDSEGKLGFQPLNDHF